MRWTMQRMMVAVLLVAVDFGLIRWAAELERNYGWGLLEAFCLFVAPRSLLAVATVNVLVALVKRGRAPAFSTGYLLIGGLASFVTCFAVLTDLPTLFAEMLGQPNSAFAYWPSTDTIWGMLLVTAFFVIPQVALALAGGSLAARLRLTLVLERHAREVPLSC